MGQGRRSCAAVRGSEVATSSRLKWDDARKNYPQKLLYRPRLVRGKLRGEPRVMVITMSNQYIIVGLLTRESLSWRGR